MDTRQLGWTDLRLTAVGFGAWAIGGGDWKFGWGPQDDDDSIAAIRRALDLGVNWIDTARVYGMGHSEEVVGRAVKGLSQRPIIATKCSRHERPDKSLHGILKRDSVLAELDGSLKRLGVETIDLYQIHQADPDADIEEGWGAIADAVKAGKVRYAGVSNFKVSQIERIQAIHPVASLQPPYSMLMRDVEKELLPFCAAHRIGVVAYSPMQKGLLTGAFSRERVAALPPNDHRRNDPRFQDPQLSRNLALVEALKPIAARRGRTVAQLAIAWVLRRPEVTSAIVGARKASQVDETVRAGDFVLDPQDIAEIETLLAAM
jgi:aryl-alcohol dehydrogenase-like predicted oxidoreductase